MGLCVCACVVCACVSMVKNKRVNIFFSVGGRLRGGMHTPLH